ncbi:MAG: SPFH domain-containing protein [Methylococcaceae bacterium]|nr:SPFH domain-containing protein [Methylococcaceae bacterium]
MTSIFNASERPKYRDDAEPPSKFGLPPGKLRSLGLLGIGAILLIYLLLHLFVYLESTEIVVIQYPWGELKSHTEPGIYPRFFGAVTKYPLSSQFSFSSKIDQGEEKDESLRLRFNDGGHATVSGVIRWEMPSDSEHLVVLHRKFGSVKAVEQQLIRPTLESSAYTTGPLMSSTESSAEKRNLLLQYMQDQAKNGTYVTRTVAIKAIDPISGVEKTVNAAEIVMENGKPLREQDSAISRFGINLLPISINQIQYDPEIEQQIQNRQKAIQDVQIAQANALKAEQEAITAAKQGEALAAKAKWEQEVIKAQKVTEAQQKLEVAQLEAQAAEQYKRVQILEGEGEAQKKQLIMNADGALDKKLEAYVAIQKAYASAIENYKGNWVPAYVSGGTGIAAGSGAQQMIEMLSIKAAKDLGLDMGVQGTGNTAKR